MAYPLKYKSPHATDLSFAKGDTIRVTGPSPDDEDWLVGETIDGSRSGGFPKDFVQAVESEAPHDPVEPTGDVGSDQVQESVPASASDDPVAVQEPESTPAPKAEAPPQAPVAATKPPAADDGEEKRPQSMKERLAFFAAAQDKPAPPPIKPKPAAGGLTWSQRQKLRQEQEAKEREEAAARGESAPPPVSAVPAPAATLPESEKAPKEQQEGAGMSAADAVSSITKGGSLKDRMAALQGSGAFGQQEEKPAPPAPSGKVWTRPAAPPQPEPEQVEGEDGASPAERDESLPEGTEAGAQDDEESEEAKEKARKAAITARLAKLGARGPMGVMPTAPPVRKQSTRSAASPSVEKPEPVAAPESTQEGVPVTTPLAAVPKEASEPEKESAAPPASIPIAAVPRRAAPPRRRTAPRTTSSTPTPAESNTPPVPERDIRLETTDSEGHPVPPQQVMVADEEAPLPMTEEQLEEQRQQEERGASIGGLEGAEAAGIAVEGAGKGADSGPEQTQPLEESEGEPVESREIVESPGEKPEPVVGAVAGADDKETGTGSIAAAGTIEPVAIPPAAELEEGLVEGGDEQDNILKEAQQGNLRIDQPIPADERSGPLSPEPITTIPLKPAGPDSPVSPVDAEEAPPPRARRMTIEDMPLDEVERKHMHEQAHDTPVQPVSQTLARDPPLPPRPAEEDDAPPPPPRRSLDKPAGPRPLPSAPTATATETAPAVPARNPDRPSSEVEAPEHHARTLPPPPPGPVPPRDEEQEEREASELGDEEVEAERGVEEEQGDVASPPPPVRKAALPTPVQVGVPTPARAPPVSVSPVEPKLVDSPTRSRTLETSPVTEPQSQASSESTEELSRRSSIAARMAKLGGVKFGMPPPQQFKKQSSGAASARELNETGEINASAERQGSVPTDDSGPAPAEKPMEEEEETPEQEAARRRATLARLRAGGALGFGMFNQGPPAADPGEADKQPVDERNLEDEAEETGDEAPPLPPSRAPAVPPSAPPVETEEEEEDDAPPPLPASRPSMSGSRPTAPAANPESPTSSSRPPIPATTQRRSLPPQPRDVDPEETAPPPPPRQLPQEPEVQEEDPEDEAPPPPPLMRVGHAAGVYGEPRTSTNGPRPSGASFDQPRAVPLPPAAERTTVEQVAPHSQASATTQSRASSEQPGRQSTTGGTRPGYDQLREASANNGAGLIRSAHAIFQQGKRGQYGDGSSTGFVMLAMQNAGMTPTEGWGQVIFEQEGGSILRRYDEPRPGDIAAFYDAKLKGKKGLSTYSQHVGSVEEPHVGVVAEFEERKHKLRVLQVERGVPEEVSYRSEDLKSGRILVHRPGI
ncbi:hypothetical protein IAR50_002708 [Cryptococcus sp. DSM 104548]